MINIFVNYEQTLTLNVNPIYSIFYLKDIIANKFNIKVENLYYNGNILDDNKTILESKIINNSTLYITKNIKGGFDSLSILLFLIYIICIFFYCILLVTGLLPIASSGYYYLLNKSINWIFSFFPNLNNYIKNVIYFILYIFRIGSIFIFLYISTSLVIYPLIYYFNNSICKSLNISKLIGLIISISYIITYVILSIPDYLYNDLNYITELSPLFRAIISPFLRILKNIIDESKFSGLYAIPFVGTPFLDGYHFGIDFITTFLGNTLREIKSISPDNCENIGKTKIKLNSNKKTLINYIINYDDIALLQQVALNYNLTSILDILPIALIPEINNYYKCEVNNLPFWEKINPFNKYSSMYYTSQLIHKGLCVALNTVKNIDYFVNDELGGTQVIANNIKTGNVAGLFTIILAPIITIILWLLGRLTV